MKPPTLAALVLVPALALALALSACSGEERGRDTADAGTPRAPRERPARDGARERSGEAAEPRPVDPATVGSIRVTCTFAGEPPRRAEINVSREPACRHETPLLTEQVVVEDGRLANVFVRIRSGHEDWIAPPPPDAPAHLAQEGCAYRPHVVALQRGQKLLVSNGDALTHNVNFRAKRNDSRNLTQARGAPPLEFELDRAEDKIPVKCDIHPWMGAIVHVEEHPWFGVSRADGTLVIAGVPPGDYVLEALHEELGKLRLDVSVPPSGEASATFEFED